ncbi:MAG: PadR family transcriptional regulator [Firmicutes bacterium]|jgi:PadR family transcriptional regulator PadR|nr:PadR family transcriptional regulator [Bacillota bacterium]
MSFDKELLRGTLELMVLHLIDTGDTYGYALTSRISELSEGRIDLKEGTLYPVLYRLENESMIESSWSTPERGVPRKYYRITEKGRARLSELRQEWHAFVECVKRVLRG